MERKPTVVALGMFDGMHIGHRELIACCVRIADAMSAVPAVYTFTHHPQAVLRGESPKSLMDAGERRGTMERLGVREVRMVPFTRELSALTPVQFVDSLASIWTLRALVVGYNYSFGQFGAGTPETLLPLGRERGFAVEIVPPVLFDGEAVSSTRIRALIERGDVKTAASMLAGPYTLTGTVIKNKQFGRTIDFPTANMQPEAGRLLPPDGVYITEARTEGGVFRAVTNVGSNPTVGGERLSIETHLLDFCGNLYGRTLSVSFLDRIRGEVRFDSSEQLKRQIARDVEMARAL